MKKLFALLFLILGISSFVLFNLVKYKNEEFGAGEYVVNDRNYFEDGEDFQKHICGSKELKSSCGILSENQGEIVLTIKEKAMDDSVAYFEEIYYLERGDTLPKLYVSKIQSRWKCQKGRGHTWWGTVPCK